MSDIEKLCKRCIVIDKGLIAYDGLLKNINTNYNNKKLVKLNLIGEPDIRLLTKFGSLKEVNGLTVVLETRKDRIQETLNQILQVIKVQDINIYDVPIEDVIHSLYEDTEANRLEDNTGE